ncbi:hypothetical protein [Pedobacter sp. GR22-6]|uniref:hypothetical protein n=1 Tax=Pedobacter sp. GR22-6 TaxID=3127957 RepID=UPI00307F2952
MNTKTTILKLALVCVLTAFTSLVSAQTDITTLAEFTTANAKITDLTQVICAGKKVQLSVPTTAGITYQWETRFPTDDGSGTGVPLGATAGETFNEPAALPAGFYTYKLKATNNTTGCAEIFDQVVFVMPAPTLTVTAPTDVAACTNVSEVFNFTAAVTNNTVGTLRFPVSYQWYTKASAGTETAVATGGTTSSLALTSPTVAETYDVYVKSNYVLKSCDEVTSNKPTITVTSGPTKPVITIAAGN